MKNIYIIECVLNMIDMDINIYIDIYLFFVLVKLCRGVI